MLSPSLVERARAHDPQLIALLWIIGVLKTVGGLLGLALVRPWGHRLPRWLLVMAAFGAGAVLVGHGGLFVFAGLLVESDRAPHLPLGIVVHRGRRTVPVGRSG